MRAQSSKRGSKADGATPKYVVCSICRQQYLPTMKRAILEQHVESKHDGSGKSFEEIFPDFGKKFKPTAAQPKKDDDGKKKKKNKRKRKP